MGHHARLSIGVVCASLLLSGCDVEQLFDESLTTTENTETKQTIYDYDRALFEPESGILLSIGQDIDSINDYVRSVTGAANGPYPAGVVNYVGIRDLDGLVFAADAGAGRNDIPRLAQEHPESALVIGVSMNGVIDQVARGDFNANIDILLNALAAYNRPVYLRWAYEVEGPWNGHNPRDLITSWHYVHERIRQLGHQNHIAMVWQTATFCPTVVNYEDWWPGDAYVDWVGFSYFAPQDCNNARINQILQFARSHGNKPVFINESSPQRYQIADLNYSADPAQGSNRQARSAQQIWDEWFKPFFELIADPRNNIKAVTYINADWDNQTRWGDFGDGYQEGYWGDSRVQAHPVILQNWLREVQKLEYIHLSDDLFERLGFSPNADNGDDGKPNEPDTGENFQVRAVSDTSAIYSFKIFPEWPTQGTFYVCQDEESECYQGVINNGRIEYTHQNLVLGRQYTALLKVPGMSTEQFPRYQFTWNGNGAGLLSSVNMGVTSERLFNVTNPVTFDHLDWVIHSLIEHKMNLGLQSIAAAVNQSGLLASINAAPQAGRLLNDANVDHLDWTINSLTEHNVGPAPRANPPEAMATPVNGAVPTSHGFAFDIEGNTLSWRWGPAIIKAPGDADLEIHCSMDKGATFQKASLTNGKATIPCQGQDYTYFFRYKNPGPLNSNPATVWVYTGYFTTEGTRVNVNNYKPFVDGSANWLRMRHPISHDGNTVSIFDAQHNNDLLRNLDRYTLWVEDSPGNVQLKYHINGNVLRVESMTRADNPNGQQFFAVSQNPGFGNLFSYGQVISFEISAIAGRTGAQTYNDFLHYVVGCGWCGKFGDPRLNVAGKAGTSAVFSHTAPTSKLERDAIFTQHLSTLHEEDMVDDFLVGHHLFHGVDPHKRGSTLLDDPDVRIGKTTCGACHLRDGRGFEPVQVAGVGLRLPPPVYGVKLLEMIEGREAGFGWEGKESTVSDQVHKALRVDHGVAPETLPQRVVELLVDYTEMLSVPARDPISYDTAGVAEGDVLFNEIGCSGCHTPIQKTRSDAPTHLRDITLRPYTDMKTWDLGEGAFRTPPLWGLGHNIALLKRNDKQVLYMHDGASKSLYHAISRHGKAAAKSRAAFNALSDADKENIIRFIQSL